MSSDHVAYLITYVSFNYIYNNRGTIDERLIKSFLLDEVSEYIINNSSSVKFNDVNDIKNFWEKYGRYNVWDAYYVKNNNWIHAKPSDEDILLNIQEMTKSLDVFEDELKVMDGKCLEENDELDNDDSIFSLSNRTTPMSNASFSDVCDISFVKEIEMKEMKEMEKNNVENENENEDENEYEDIEFDWKTISNQEQEQQSEIW